MTKKEAKILATIIEIKYKMNSKSLEWRNILKDNNLQYMLEINDIKRGNLEVILSSLRKKGILYKNQINEKYIVPFEEEGGIIFSIKMRDENKD